MQCWEVQHLRGHSGTCRRAFFLNFSLHFLRKAALGAHIYLDAAAWVCDTEVATSREWSICTTDTSHMTRADTPLPHGALPLRSSHVCVPGDVSCIFPSFFLHFSLRFLRKPALGAHIYLDAAAWVCDTQVATGREWSICTTGTSYMTRADTPLPQGVLQ